MIQFYSACLLGCQERQRYTRPHQGRREYQATDGWQNNIHIHIYIYIYMYMYIEWQPF